MRGRLAWIIVTLLGWFVGDYGINSADASPPLRTVTPAQILSEKIQPVGGTEPIPPPPAVATVFDAPPAESAGQLYVFVDFMVLKPRWNSNPAFFAFNDNTYAMPSIEFPSSSEFVPRITLGGANANGFGGRIVWWSLSTSSSASRFDDDDDTGFVSPYINGLFVDDHDAGMVAFSNLKMNVFDFQFTQSWTMFNCLCMISAGGRYAHLSQNFQAIDYDRSKNGIVPDEKLIAGHNFNGIGPSLGFMAQRGIIGGLYLKANVQGALLFGEVKQNAFQSDDVEQTSQTFNKLIPTLEFELGTGYQRTFGILTVLIEAGINAQAWFNAGNASLVEDGIYDEGNFWFAPRSHTTLGLVGWYLRTGVIY